MKIRARVFLCSVVCRRKFSSKKNDVREKKKRRNQYWLLLKAEMENGEGRRILHASAIPIHFSLPPFSCVRWPNVLSKSISQANPAAPCAMCEDWRGCWKGELNLFYTKFLTSPLSPVGRTFPCHKYYKLRSFNQRDSAYANGVRWLWAGAALCACGVFWSLRSFIMFSSTYSSQTTCLRVEAIFGVTRDGTLFLVLSVALEEKDKRELMWAFILQPGPFVLFNSLTV